MKQPFFPHNKNFWLLHGGVLITLQAVFWVTTFLWGDQKFFNIVATFVWSLVFTIATLLFRLQYKKQTGFSKSIFKRSLFALAYAFGLGVAVAVITLGLVTPFFWNELLTSGIMQSMQVTPTQFLFRITIQNTIQSQLLLSVWMFIYISISSWRQIKEAELVNLRLQNSLKESQLANLHNQLNPHFLFNALNNIRFTIHEDANKADSMLTALSEMLRYSLESNKQDKVRLAEELEMIERYIALIKVQMEDRLVFEKSIPQSLTHFLIPPMILQLLIENAIKHGIDKLRHGGIIKLSVTESSDKITFVLTNTRGDSQLLLPHSQSSTGIGLANIESRLNLLYAHQASMMTETLADQFVVRLVLPKELPL